MWGNPEDMELALRTGDERGLPVIEDACLALGTRVGGKMAGATGTVGVFSFGCMKPIQGGEGGMIVTHDAALAKELRSLRHWGDRAIDFGVRDTTQLAWNGRMSEIVAAVVREQLRAYPAYLRNLRSAVADFARFLEGVEGIDLVLGNTARLEECAFTQVVVRYDEKQTRLGKQQFRDALADRGIPTWHANFEAINSLAFFRNGSWRDWILAGDVSRAAANYTGDFPVCRAVYAADGLGFSRENFLSPSRLRALKAAIAERLNGSKP
jgi:dTDP-4-amino-4,6-dideoxygalactose transaminase